MTGEGACYTRAVAKGAMAGVKKAVRWADEHHFYAVLGLMAAALLMAVYMASRARLLERSLESGPPAPAPGQPREIQWQF